jgi:hypothetical protein
VSAETEQSLATHTKEGTETSTPENIRPLRALRETPLRFRVLIGAWKFFLGVLMSQSLLLSFVVVGWVARAMQRMAFYRWWKLSDARKCGLSFSEFIASIPGVHSHWPNWFLAPRRDGTRGWRRFIGSFITNAKLGVQMVFNTWALTLPGCIVMLFSWGYGWNNSFNKGYELAPIGPATGLLGITLFIAAMLYVPMAQAHQATTGNWRAFYQWRIVWRVVRHRWLACLLLALAYSAVSLPVIVQRIRPMGFDAAKNLTSDTFVAMDPKRVEGELSVYFLGAGLIVLGGYILVRWLAARIYARGILRAVKAQGIPEFALSEMQHAALEKLGYFSSPPPLPRHPVLHALQRLTSLALRFAAGFAFAFVWFTFCAQIYIAQFLNYIPLVGWMNQPLVQLPWIKYVPAKINGELWSLFLVALITLVVLGVQSAVRQVCPPQVRAEMPPR